MLFAEPLGPIALHNVSCLLPLAAHPAAQPTMCPVMETSRLPFSTARWCRAAALTPSMLPPPTAHCRLRTSALWASMALEMQLMPTQQQTLSALPAQLGKALLHPAVQHVMVRKPRVERHAMFVHDAVQYLTTSPIWNADSISSNQIQSTITSTLGDQYCPKRRVVTGAWVHTPG